ncbi:uncharacterized protein DUF5071 [Kordia periserrulae]|uniref:Uncharacterized protein DUF5071 n=1 Tax=Kordia periserrulae TaxID=701523 RepID=A0A2T6C6Z9_9FLAO|nr:DUF5071 domain-containing protein [Kordia periserrulae]PTX64094.1 uncharacterized protein DUF5071 [Kordia periserrulae]
MKPYIPKNKSDEEFHLFLNKKKINEIREDVYLLLEWLQDINWPVVKYVSAYLNEYTNEIADDIIKVLNGTDEEWKYSIMHTLILNSNKKPNEFILNRIKKIYYSPTEEEKYAELVEIAEDILNKYDGSC